MRDSTESAQPVGHARPDRPGSASDQRRDLTMAQWRELINASFAALEITAPVESAFRADLTTVELDDVHLFDMTTNAHRVVRTAEMVEQDAGEYLKLSLQLEGEAQLRQDGRECVLSPGSLGLYVAYRPYELVYEGPQRSMIMTFPRSVVQLIPAQLDLVTARRIGQEDGLGRVAVPMFRNLAENMDLLRGPHAIKLVRSALDMLVSVLSAEVVEPAAEQAGDLLVQQATAYIADHLADPELSPGSVARALYVSVRQLHSRFAAQGLTVASHIRAARLTAVRAALADPAHRQEAVHTLSARCGLTDPAHVSKIFKAEFGETPSAYRRRVLASS
ncbi:MULTISPECIES: helix-turn-helix domain-containing protein [Kocuria]|uniref:AraC-like ligand-binding domain-containing protein n=1 Tax=Kocuria TaxID=57493 RepID=UPI00031C6BDF|nr:MULTISPECIES: helix-turn-helix domain-containing protein [Kocuria]KUP27210.1 AraC family transcriptional regulator [Kocuria rhizophila]MCT1545263.1 helix-turn-helix domain-containing protein [Kocuria rhizophila]MCT2172238.1 helix-turn-helix domain-containing protein [Kocuria rhizophila]MDA4829633.1 helix-turn-helix domain-containing protein [Kocuria rhizophila]MDN3463021.1 helix-turn-helix domain-containing protein [Kocuria sp. APC 4018]